MNNLGLRLLPMPPELRLLLMCSRPAGIGADKEAMGALIRRDIDWDVFTHLVDYHRLTATVYTNLSQSHLTSFPEKILQYLRAHYLRNARRAVWLAAKLAALVRLFEKEGILVLPLKGPVLALQVFGDVTLRHAGDLDLLVAPDNVKRATDLLSQAGFQPEKSVMGMSPRQYKTFMSIRCQSRHYHRTNGLLVELHWNWFHNRYLFPLYGSEVWEKTQNLKISSQPVPAMGIDHTLLYLCCHGAKHGWYRLFWLFDVARLVLRVQGNNWERLLDRAVNLGLERALAQGIVLSKLLFGGPVPEPIRVLMERDPAVTELVHFNLQVVTQKIKWPPRSLMEHILRQRYALKLRRDIRYKLMGCLSGLLFSPDDWPLMPLPDELFPLYYAFGPFIRLRRLYN